MAGFGLAQMNSLLAAQNTLKAVSDLNAQRTSLNGQMGVLGTEIETDKDRGIDTAAKEERYATMEGNANAITERLAETATSLNDKIAEENEKIREEEAAKADESAKAEKSANDLKSGEMGTDGMSANTDTVEISMFARNIAASAPHPAQETPVKKAAQTGAVVNVKA